MTIQRAVEVECPECGEKQKVTVWETLNANEDPDAKKDLLKGRINVFRCQKCDNKSLLDTSLLYHDMKKNFFVQYYPFRLLENDKFLDDFTIEADGRLRIGSFSKGMEAMRKETEVECAYAEWTHIVFDMMELVRYIMFIDRLYEHGRSDVQK
jgi:hypothetical protein